MQERYSVIEYSPHFNIARRRDEYVNAGFCGSGFAVVVKETRPDGRHSWRRGGKKYSVMFSRDAWEVRFIWTTRFDGRRDGHRTDDLDKDTQEFRDIAAEVTEFFTRMSTTTIKGTEARK